MMKDGVIELDTVAGNELGFTSDKFLSGSYLWKKEWYIFISFIQSRERRKGYHIASREQRKGYISTLFDTILSKGYGIKVPNPSALMEAIIIKKGFERTEETSERYPENVEVWVKEKNK